MHCESQSFVSALCKYALEILWCSAIDVIKRQRAELLCDDVFIDWWPLQKCACCYRLLG